MKLVQITVGIVATILTLVILLFVGLGEPNRMAAEEASQLGKSIEEGALLFGEYCKPCHGPQAKGIEGLCPPLNDQYFFTGRLKDVGYPGTLRATATYSLLPDGAQLTYTATTGFHPAEPLRRLHAAVGPGLRRTAAPRPD